MKVIPKQKEYEVIKFDYSDEMYIKIGKYLKENVDYKLEKNCLCSHKDIFLNNNGEFFKVAKDSVLLVDIDDVKKSIYTSKNTLNTDYIIIN